MPFAHLVVVMDKITVLTEGHAAHSTEDCEYENQDDVSVVGDVEDEQSDDDDHDGLPEHHQELSDHMSRQDLNTGYAWTFRYIQHYLLE